MTTSLALQVALAGAVGAVLRHELTARPDPVRATAVVNVVGAALLGVAVVALDDPALVVVGGGLLGALTTFSTWMVQADRAQRPLLVAVLPLLVGVVAAAAAAAAARALGLGA